MIKLANDELVVLNTRIPKELKSKIKLLAVMNEITMQELIKELLLSGLDDYEK